MGRPAAGVIGIRLGDRDRVIAFEVIEPGGDLLVVAANGLGKRTSVDQYPSQGRGGKGVTAMKLSPKTGDIVAAGMVKPEQTVVMLSTGGQVIRIPAAQISRIGRATQGVTLMRMGAKETVASMTVVEPKSETAGNGLVSSNGVDGSENGRLS
jgi:DNA gyrase subunit A